MEHQAEKADGNGIDTRRLRLTDGPNFPNGGNLNAEDVRGSEILGDITKSELPDGLLGLAGQGFGGRLKNATGVAAYAAKQKMIAGAKKLPKKMARMTRRVGLGAAGAIPMAALAAGIGAATGDPSKAAALAVAAGASGANFTNYYGDKFAKGVGDVTKLGQAGFWGKDMKKVQQYKFDKKFTESPELLAAVTKVTGDVGQARELIKSGAVQAFLNSGETNEKRIAKSLAQYKDKVDKLKTKEKYQRANAEAKKQMERQELEQAVSRAWLVRNMHPATFQKDSREQIAWKQRKVEEYMSQGVSKNSATEAVDEIIDQLSDIWEAGNN